MCEDVSRRAEDYFSSLNSMANRIIVDSTSTNGGRQNRDRDEEFFAPRQVRDKYAFYLRTDPDVDCIPKLYVRSGEKYVVDEDSHGKGSGCSWRDEHSGPFIWETQSQLDLSLIGTENVVPNDSSNESSANVVDVGKESVSSKKISKYRKEDYGELIKNHDSMETAPSPSRNVLTKRMEKQLSGKCFNKAPLTSAVLPPLPDRPPPVVSTNKSVSVSTATSTMKCPPPRPPSKKSPLKKPSSPPKQQPAVNSCVNVAAHDIVVPTDVKASISSKIRATESVTTAQIELVRELRSLEIDQSPSEDIPKTGFDFLDNW